MKNYTKHFASLVVLAGSIAAAPVFAGGPLAVCESGVPFLWPNGGDNIVFNPDQGNLGPVSGPVAIALVDAAFQAWEDIPSSTMTYAPGAQLPVDVDITNFGPYLNPVAPDGLSAVVFDDDGAIFDLLYGPGSGILGFAGPEWIDGINCEILEGVSFLNGPSFTNATAAIDVMVHEFGHWTNFAHTVVNGQIYLGSVGGDSTGPTPFDTFGAPPDPFSDVIETMYPFYYGPGIGTATLEADDIAIASRMYPQPDYASTTGEISGTIFFGSSRSTGVNVIARNVADPFHDAVSAISSDFTDSTSQSDPNVGVYRITGLTPGEDYGVYVDEVLAGGFSTALASPLPGPEDLYNGIDESGDPNTDDPSVYTPVTVAAGSPNTGIDIYFNQPGEGDPLPVGDDGSVQLGLPFTFSICGQDFGDVFVNANGNLTFGAPNSDFSESTAEFLDGPPRVAGLWDDLNPSAGGAVYYNVNKGANKFTVTWEDVPEFFATGSNTFSVELKKGSSQVTVSYSGLSATDGLAGLSCGLAQTGGLEQERNLNPRKRRTTHNFNHETAVFELFDEGDLDLANYQVKYNTAKHKIGDAYEENNSLDTAAAISVPFNTAPNSMLTEISPSAGDIDFFSVNLEAGTTLIADVQRGQLDSVMGLWYCPGGVCDSGTAIFLGFNDDKGFGSNPLLSGFLFEVPISGTFAIGVTFCCDYDFDGVDPGQGDPLDGGRYVLDLQVINGVLLSLGDDDSEEVPFTGGFSFPFQGNTETSVFINSNGNLTFGEPNFDFSESTAEFLAGPPRIAPLWDDLSPNNGGFVFFNQGVDTFTVTFQNVPEFFATGANTFSVTLGSDGSVGIDYGSLTAADGLAGVTEGGGAADPGATDLSASPSQPVAGTTYELFDFGNPNDLSGASLDFD